MSGSSGTGERRLAVLQVMADSFVTALKPGSRGYEVVADALPEDAEMAGYAFAYQGEHLVIRLLLRSASFAVVPDGKDPPLLPVPKVELLKERPPATSAADIRLVVADMIDQCPVPIQEWPHVPDMVPTPPSQEFDLEVRDERGKRMVRIDGRVSVFTDMPKDLLVEALRRAADLPIERPDGR